AARLVAERTGTVGGNVRRRRICRCVTMSTPRIDSRIRTDSAEFRENADASKARVAELRERVARARHTERGKLVARDRVDALIDPGTAFLELSPLAAFGMYDGDAPAAGIV